MATQFPNGTLRIVYHIVFFVIAAAVVWGVTKSQVNINAQGVLKLETKKLDKEVFNLYREQQKIMADRTYNELKSINDKIDEALDRK